MDLSPGVLAVRGDVASAATLCAEGCIGDTPWLCVLPRTKNPTKKPKCILKWRGRTLMSIDDLIFFPLANPAINFSNWTMHEAAYKILTCCHLPSECH